MPELLIEFFSEEIPSSMQKEGAGKLKELIMKKLDNEGISFGTEKLFYSSRRIGLNLKDVLVKLPNKTVELRGPRFEAPKIALKGFVTSNKISKNNLFVKETNKGQFWFAKIYKEGSKTVNLIPKIITEIILNFPWPKSQRWGDKKIRWVRPLKAINIIFDNKPVKFKINEESDDFFTSNSTLGHPIVSKKCIKFFSYKEYKSLLKKEFVIVDPVDRKNIIIEQISKYSNLIPI